MIAALYFDLWENVSLFFHWVQCLSLLPCQGILDIFLVIKDDNNMRIEALQQWLASDHMFLKVTSETYPYLCKNQSCILLYSSVWILLQRLSVPYRGVVSWCDNYHHNRLTPHSLLVPCYQAVWLPWRLLAEMAILKGLLVLYCIEAFSLSVFVVSTAVSVLGSSALNNPHLPFLLIGLAATPNYIERLTIGVGHNNTHQQQNWHREWRLLVPNAQVILVPSPSASPSQ